MGEVRLRVEAAFLFICPYHPLTPALLSLLTWHILSDYCAYLLPMAVKTPHGTCFNAN